mmetsp:Transcript_51348/g.122210  ORF Transcript_51348/g.122210 Transcript_51348/m.122210 type:complete len:317 (-) Transcript_51348:1323-2273(-)
MMYRSSPREQVSPSRRSLARAVWLVALLQLHFEVLHLLHDALAEILLLSNLLLELRDSLEVFRAALAGDQLELQVLDPGDHGVVGALKLLLRRAQHLLGSLLERMVLLRVFPLQRELILHHPLFFCLHLLEELDLESLDVVGDGNSLLAALLRLVLLHAQLRLHGRHLLEELLDLALGILPGLPQRLLALLLPLVLRELCRTLVLVHQLPQIQLAAVLGLLLLPAQERFVLLDQRVVQLLLLRLVRLRFLPVPLDKARLLLLGELLLALQLPLEPQQLLGLPLEQLGLLLLMRGLEVRQTVLENLGVVLQFARLLV